MTKKSKILVIVSILLLIPGLIFLGISLFSDGHDTKSLTLALLFIAASNFVSAYRSMSEKKK